jgi:hypothetical protein
MMTIAADAEKRQETCASALGLPRGNAHDYSPAADPSGSAAHTSAPAQGRAA